jgi:hypothetical protein
MRGHAASVCAPGAGPDHGRIEAETLARWNRDRVFERLREQNVDGPTFS